MSTEPEMGAPSSSPYREDYDGVQKCNECQRTNFSVKKRFVSGICFYWLNRSAQYNLATAQSSIESESVELFNRIP